MAIFTLDAASGGAYDWTKITAGVKYTYAPELRPSSGRGFEGFIIDESNIVPSGREILAMLKAMVSEIERIG